MYKNYLFKLLWTTFENDCREPETVVWLILCVVNTTINILCPIDSFPVTILSTACTASTQLFRDYDHQYHHRHYHLRAPVITCLCWCPSTSWWCRVRLSVENLADSQSSSGLSVYEGKIWRRNYKCSPKTAFFHIFPIYQSQSPVCSERRVITSAFDELSLNRLKKTVFLSVLEGFCLSVCLSERICPEDRTCRASNRNVKPWTSRVLFFRTTENT